jgi:hypothetical protein
MASPPTTIVPLPVVIAERPIPLAAERVTAPVISDSHVASTIIGGVRGPVDREVSIPIDCYVIAATKLIRVPKTINVCVPCPIDLEVSIAIDRYVVAFTKLVRVSKTINVRVPCPVHCDISFAIRVEISGPIHRDVPVAINRNVTLRAKLLFPLEIALAHPFVPGEVSLANSAQSGVVSDHGI